MSGANGDELAATRTVISPTATRMGISHHFLFSTRNWPNSRTIPGDDSAACRAKSSLGVGDGFGGSGLLMVFLLTTIGGLDQSLYWRSFVASRQSDRGRGGSRAQRLTNRGSSSRMESGYQTKYPRHSFCSIPELSRNTIVRAALHLLGNICADSLTPGFNQPLVNGPR
jgi:hypothetical protein